MVSTLNSSSPRPECSIAVMRRFFATLLGALLALCWAPAVPAAPPELGPINFSPTVPVEGQSINFVLLATDPEGQTMTRSWDFGDGSGSNEVDPSHSYSTDGVFQVQCTVTDSAGESASSSVQVVVENASPVIEQISGDLSGETGVPLSLIATVTDPGGDAIEYAWDFGDSSPVQAGPNLSTVSHAFSAAGVYLVTLVATDAQGAFSQETVSIDVNAVPVISALNVDRSSSVEGDVVSFEVVASDADGHVLAYQWDFGDGSLPLFSASPSHAFADDGDFTVSVTVTDQLGAVTSQSMVFPVLNGPPQILALVGQSSGPMGQALTFRGSVIDPAGGADTLTWSWDWGDGGTASDGVDLHTATHSWSGAGSYSLVLTVADEDGGSTSQTLPVLISNPGPSIGPVTGPVALDEGSIEAFQVSAADAAGNPVDISWSWGDGSAPDVGLALAGASHAYSDDGSYTVTATASDAFGATVSSSLQVEVLNVAPSFDLAPALTATEGIAYTVVLSSVDPGTDEPSYTPLQVPVGTVFDSAAASLVWEPTLTQVLAGPAQFEVRVEDGDGGSDIYSWSVVSSWVDGDGDAMADSWETAFGLDPLQDDAAEDLDSDGVSNLDEWLGETDPSAPNGPEQPQPLAPVLGATVHASIPVLVVENAIDVDDNVESYDFEIYEDAGLLTLLYSGTEAEDDDGETEHATVSGLPENRILYWRARASDPGIVGAWSQVAEFFMDAMNDRPDTPQPLYPVDTSVATPTPTLIVAPVAEPEGEELELTASLFEDGVGLVATVVGSAAGSGDGSWVFQLSSPLAEDGSYQWSAVAVDARGLPSLPSELVSFQVDAGNQAPLVPEFVDLDAELATDVPELIARIGEDPDGDDQLLRFEVDSRADFSSPDIQSLALVEPDTEGVGRATVAMPLPENEDAWVRVRGEDSRGSVSPWNLASFFVNAQEEAPGPVVVSSPAVGQTVSGLGLELRWMASLDPDRDPLTYTLRVLSEDGELVWEEGGLSLATGNAALEGSHQADIELAAGGYMVSARATDDTGLEGPWGPENGFVVLATPGSGVDLEDFGTGCQCSQGSQPLSARSGLVALFVLLPLVIRRLRKGC